MSKNLFRDNYTDKLSSPEQLDSYIRIINPQLWILLVVLIIVLINTMVWTFAENHSIRVATVAMAHDGELTVYVREQDKVLFGNLGEEIGFVENESKVTFTDLLSISDSPVEITDETDHYLLHFGLLNVGDWVYEFNFKADIPDGVYSGYLRNI